MIPWIILLASNISAQSYGEYRFYKNYGHSFYDYGTDTYHGYNGSTPESDANDGIHTDRGVYLDGVSDYVTIHNNYWNTPPTFVFPFEFAVLALVFSEGPLFYRFDSTSQTMIRATLEPSGEISIAYADLQGSNYFVFVYSSSTGAYTIGEWNLFHFVLRPFNSGHEMEILVNFSSVMLDDNSSGNYDETLQCETIMGYYESDYLQGFFYSLYAYKLGFVNLNLAFTQTCAINDQSCSVCPSSTSTCLLHSSSFSVNNDGSACTGCTNGCLADMTCLDCSADSMPFCESGTPLPIPSPCDASCSSCVGPGASECTACTDPNLHVPSPPDECLCVVGCQACTVTTTCTTCQDANATPKTDGSGGCECNPGFYEDSSHSCLICHADCSTCDSASTCLTCSGPTAVLDSNQNCSCPSNSSFDGTQCVCISSFYDSDSSSSVQCDPCFSHCLTCAGPSLCLTCKDPIATLNSSEGCDCPANATMANSVCVCIPGYYMNSSNVCQTCPSTCQECDSSSCTVCAVFRAVPGLNYECSCPSNSSEINTQCECNSGLYYNNGVCEQCHEDCETCEDSKLCLTCKNTNLSPDSVEGCECPVGSSLRSGACICDEGYYTNSSGVCESCTEGCASCDDTTCIECLDSKASIDSDGECKCPAGSEMAGEVCVCLEGYEWSSSFDRCIQSVNAAEEILKFADSPTTVATTMAGAFAGTSTAFMNDPMTLWTIINSVQMFSYLSLHNVNMTDRMELVTKNFEIGSYVPNLVILVYGRSDITQNIEKENWKVFLESVSFFENIGECTTTLAICILALGLFLISYTVFPCWRIGTVKKLQSFKYGAFLRLILELYLVIVFASILPFSNFCMYSQTDSENTIGAIVFILCALTPLGLLLLLYKIHRQILEENERVIRSFGTLFDEFHVTEDFRSLIFYPCFLSRRLAYIISLFYFYEYPKFQFVVNTGCSMCMILVIWGIVKFRSRARFLFELLSEASTCLILFSLSLLNLNLRDTTKDYIEYLVILLAFSIFGANFFFIIWKTTEKIWKKYKKKESNEIARVVPISKAANSRELEPVLVSSGEMRANSRRENNSRHQDMTYLGQVQNDLY